MIRPEVTQRGWRGVKIQELANELTAKVNPFTGMVSFENDP